LAIGDFRIADWGLTIWAIRALGQSPIANRQSPIANKTIRNRQ
jgi:hypothetical protein